MFVSPDSLYTAWSFRAVERPEKDRNNHHHHQPQHHISISPLPPPFNTPGPASWGSRNPPSGGRSGRSPLLSCATARRRRCSRCCLTAAAAIRPVWRMQVHVSGDARWPNDARTRPYTPSFDDDPSPNPKSHHHHNNANAPTTTTASAAAAGPCPLPLPSHQQWGWPPSAPPAPRAPPHCCYCCSHCCRSCSRFRLPSAEAPHQ